MPSAAANEALYAQETGEVFLQLVEIAGDELPEPLRFVHNTQAIISNGNTYEACKFGFAIPTGKMGNSTRAQLSISNIDRRPVETVRTITKPLTLTGMIIRASEPDLVESGPFVFTLRQVKWNANTLSGDLYDDIEGGMSVPKIRYNPADFPGLY